MTCRSISAIQKPPSSPSRLQVGLSKHTCYRLEPLTWCQSPLSAFADYCHTIEGTQYKWDNIILLVLSFFDYVLPVATFLKTSQTLISTELIKQWLAGSSVTKKEWKISQIPGRSFERPHRYNYITLLDLNGSGLLKSSHTDYIRPSGIYVSKSVSYLRWKTSEFLHRELERLQDTESVDHET